MSAKSNMSNSVKIGTASDFDEFKSMTKIRAAMKSESYVEVAEETFPFNACYMCETSYCEEIRFGSKKHHSIHVIHLCKQCQRKMGQFLIKNSFVGPMHSFQDFYERLAHKTAEEILKEAGFENIKAAENIVKDDEFLADFLKSINVEIESYGAGYCLMRSGSKWYEVPYQENWLDWGKVLGFRRDTIYDVTDSYV